MKFCNTWRQAIRQLPEELRPYCLDYKKYKRLTKQDVAPEHIFALLQQDLQHSNNTFERYLHPPRQSKLLPFGLTRHCLHDDFIQPTHLQPSDLSDYAEINTTTLYKICKRIDKMYHQRMFMPWYQSLKVNHTISLVSNMRRVCLNLDAGTSTIQSECPICLECPESSFFVLACGHIMCESCTLNMLGVSKLRGTLHNRIAYGCYQLRARAHCPLCRDPRAFSTYKVYAKQYKDMTQQ